MSTNNQDVFALSSEYETLQDMVDKFTFKWPENFTCATQESDGVIIWWNIPVERVKEARQSACVIQGLIPILGNSSIAHMTYYTSRPQKAKKVTKKSKTEKALKNNKQNLTALDWRTSVILPPAESLQLDMMDLLEA